jgi:uncharacterized coiled-coil protein SlyX
MTKAAITANRIKELEARNAELEGALGELQITIDAQAQEIVDQLNKILSLRRETLGLRAASNGAPVELLDPDDDDGEPPA